MWQRLPLLWLCGRGLPQAARSCRVWLGGVVVTADSAAVSCNGGGGALKRALFFFSLQISDEAILDRAAHAVLYRHFFGSRITHCARHISMLYTRSVGIPVYIGI